MTLRAEGTTGGAITRNRMPRLCGRSWHHVGDSATLKTCITAGREREKYPGFSLFLFCSLPLFLLLTGPDKRPVGKGGWEASYAGGLEIDLKATGY